MLKKLITLHAIAAAATTIIYTWLTHGDWAYIFAMMCYCGSGNNDYLYMAYAWRLGVHICYDGAL